ncbi:MAG: tryptophan-rich sensory protein, partial [Clostridia bacterium]|nr:tryptophan-rich sensory protein [Clostridia bacterium]
MIIKFNLKKFVVSLAIPWLVGAFSSLITMGDRQIYNEVTTPPLSPPSWLFPVVWGILYTLMGISLYLVWNKYEMYPDKKKAYLLFSLQLFLNFLWSPVFFTARNFLLA